MRRKVAPRGCLCAYHISETVIKQKPWGLNLLNTVVSGVAISGNYCPLRNCFNTNALWPIQRPVNCGIPLREGEKA